MKSLLFVVLLALLQANLLLARRWHRVVMDDNNPFPRVGMGLAPHGDSEFFFFAGAIENITGVNFFFNDFWLFEFDKVGGDFEGEWTLLSPDGPIPSTRAFPAMDIVTKSNGHKFICMFGGGRFDNAGSVDIVTDTFYTYNVQTDTWTNRTSLGGPSPRLGALGVADGNKFYVHAGLDASFETHNDLWVFDIDELSWTQITPSTAVRPPATVSPVGDILYKNANQKELVVTSGTVLTSDFGFNNLTMAFKFNTNSWVDLTDPRHNPSPRTFTAAAASQNRKHLMMYGGDLPGGIHGCGNFAFDNPSNDTWRFNARNDNWRELNFSPVEHPPQLKRHGAVQVDKYFFVMGGYNFICPGPGQVLNDDVYVTNNK